MSLNFPSSPSVDDTYTVGARTWTWTGSIWELRSTTVGVGSIGTTELADSAITSAKIAAGAVAEADIANSAVTQTKLADRSVGSSKLTGLTINAQTGTTYTLALSDAHDLVTLSNASAISLTVPTNASVAFDIGDQVNIVQLGAGQVTVGGAGVTLRSQGSKLKLNGQYSAATLIKINSDEWVLVGNTAA
jgi:hypothetical protein